MQCLTSCLFAIIICCLRHANCAKNRKPCTDPSSGKTIRHGGTLNVNSFRRRCLNGYLQHIGCLSKTARKFVPFGGRIIEGDYTWFCEHTKDGMVQFRPEFTGKVGCRIKGKFYYNGEIFIDGTGKYKCNAKKKGGYSLEPIACMFKTKDQQQAFWVTVDKPIERDDRKYTCLYDRKNRRISGQEKFIGPDGCTVDGTFVNYGDIVMKKDMFKFRCKKTGNGWTTKAEACKWKQDNGGSFWVKCNIPRKVNGETGYCKCNNNYVSFVSKRTDPLQCSYFDKNANERFLNNGETYLDPYYPFKKQCVSSTTKAVLKSIACVYREYGQNPRIIRPGQSKRIGKLLVKCKNDGYGGLFMQY